MPPVDDVGSVSLFTRVFQIGVRDLVRVRWSLWRPSWDCSSAGFSGTPLRAYVVVVLA